MKLSELQMLVSAFVDDDFVFSRAFDDVMSYRGYYDQVAFSPACGVTASKIKDLVAKAFSETFEGYKGGEYTYNADTDCYLAYYGSYKDENLEDFEHLVKEMLYEYSTKS